MSYSARYFSALSKGEPFPVTERVEMYTATQKTDSGLTPGLLKVLHQQVRLLLSPHTGLPPPPVINGGPLN